MASDLRPSGNREVVLAAVAQNGYVYALWLASAELQGGHEGLLMSVAQSRLALRLASAELQGGREVVLASVAQNGPALPSCDRCRGIVISRWRQWHRRGMHCGMILQS